MESSLKNYKTFFVVLLITGVSLWSIFSSAQERDQYDINSRMDPANETNKKEVKKPEPITLLFVGDMMADRGVRGMLEKRFDGDYNKLFEYIPEIGEADIAFGNLEGPIADPSIGTRRGSRFSFRMNPLFAEALGDAGFDVVSFANNHVGDYGDGAFRETLRLLEEKGVRYAGAGRNIAEAQTPVIIEKEGVRIGFLAFSDVGPEWMEATETRAGQLIYRKETAEALVRDVDTQVDILFVSIHFGAEYSLASTDQENIARGLVDAGADGIIGHHPHVMQRWEWYKEKPIFYSLGNFIFDQYFSPHTMRGMVVKMTIQPETKVMTVEPFITIHSSSYVPEPLEPFDESLLITKAFRP
jgi:poly-gamma-glutamate capsule biosynthesis protein CapA/YwtB (metallophosphatase superfamily)